LGVACGLCRRRAQRRRGCPHRPLSQRTTTGAGADVVPPALALLTGEAANAGEFMWCAYTGSRPRTEGHHDPLGPETRCRL